MKAIPDGRVGNQFDLGATGAGTGVSLVASMLQQADFIHYSRGHIQITNLDGLRRTACECYGSVKAHYERLLRPRCTS